MVIGACVVDSKAEEFFIFEEQQKSSFMRKNIDWLKLDRKLGEKWRNPIDGKTSIFGVLHPVLGFRKLSKIVIRAEFHLYPLLLR